MSAITSKVDICNLANGSLGNRNTINNIDTPKTDKEIVYALWYDIVRQYMLKVIAPNFALDRRVVSAVAVPTAYALEYGYAYEYPSDCLRLLGIGRVDCVSDPPTVENGKIFTNTQYADGAPLRFVRDVDNPTEMTADFIMTFAAVLSKCTALSTTQDPVKKAAALKDSLAEVMNTTAMNAMENKPVRVSNSRFRAARYGTPGYNSEKR